MTGEDQSTNITLPAVPVTDLTGIYVALGRIEEKQNNTATTLGEIRTSVNGVVGTLSSHSARLAVLESQANPRNPWYVVVGGWAGIAAIAFSIWAVLHP
jgi:hypothetical protein